VESIATDIPAIRFTSCSLLSGLACRGKPALRSFCDRSADSCDSLSFTPFSEVGQGSGLGIE
jgi:hypothetical protein